MNQILDESETATSLGISPRTLQSWRARGQGPPYIRLGSRRIGYDPRDLDAWRERNRLDPEQSRDLEPRSAA